MNPKKAADKGFCPFCECNGLEICDHFIGYARAGKIVVPGRRGFRLERLGAGDATVETGITVRVYNPVPRRINGAIVTQKAMAEKDK